MMEYSKKAPEYGQIIWAEIDNENTRDFKKALNNYISAKQESPFTSGFVRKFGLVKFGENNSFLLSDFKKSFKRYFYMD